MLYTQLIICKYNENSVHERKFVNYYKIALLMLFGREIFRAPLTPHPTLPQAGGLSISKADALIARNSLNLYSLHKNGALQNRTHR